MAVASVYQDSIQILTITPQSIYCNYVLGISSLDYNFNIDISPSGNYAVVAFNYKFILYQIG